MKFNGKYLFLTILLSVVAHTASFAGWLPNVSSWFGIAKKQQEAVCIRNNKIGELSHEKVVFAWDLHGVLIKRKLGKIFWETLKMVNTRLAWSLVRHPGFIFTAIKLFCFDKKGGFTEELLERLASTYNYEVLNRKDLEKCIKISNLQELDQDAITILSALKERGYRQVLFSNIGPIARQSLEENSKNQTLRELFDKFEDKITAIKDSEDANKYIKKPNEEAYDRLAVITGADKGNIIFIDDSRRNLKAATGINTIHYTSPKNLLESLKEFGINNLLN